MKKLETIEELLAKFNKANNQWKGRYARQAGYNTTKEYENFLLDNITENVIENTQEELTDIVIAFDTTGSMMSYIGKAKGHIKKLIPQMFKDNENLKLSIIAFGDYCDMTNKDEFGTAYQCINLTSDENKLIDFVKNAKNTGGGDGDEFYELVIKKIREETKWRKGATKSVLLIADASPHRVGYSYGNYVTYNNIDWREEAQKSADMGIKYDTLSINPHVGWMKELSQITFGLNLPFSNSQETHNLLKTTMSARGGSNTRFAFKNLKEESKTWSVNTVSTYTKYEKELL